LTLAPQAEDTLSCLRKIGFAENPDFLWAFSFLERAAMASDWIEELVAARKRELEVKRFNEEKDLSDRKMLDAHSETMWSEVWVTVEEAVNEYNARTGEHRISFQGMDDRSKFLLRVGTQQTDIFFNTHSWVLSSPFKNYVLTVAEGNGVVWQERKGHRGTYTSEQVAGQLVRKALYPNPN
jgi:hypothetical protein